MTQELLDNRSLFGSLLKVLLRKPLIPFLFMY